MVLKRFAAVPGSAVLAAPQDTGKRSSSPPLLSLPHSRKPAAADLAGCHKDRIGPAKLAHSRSSPHVQSASASLQKPSQAQYRLTRRTVIWEQPQNHLCVCWSQTGTEQAELLVTAVIHHRSWPLCFWELLLKVLLLTTPEEGIYEWASLNAPVLNPGTNTCLPLLIALALVSEGLGDEGGISERRHLRCFNPA